MLIHDNIDHVLTSLEKTPVEKLILGVEGCQAVAAVILFILALVVLDTLPSFKPLAENGSNLHVLVHNGERVATYSESFRIFKPSDYVVKRTIRYTGGSVELPATQATLVQTSTYVFHHVIPVEGPVCVERAIFWTPGLSIRQHSTQLEPICVR